ncbi:MAG: hypothetical protein M1820_005414 [Bogoriella megaspora]|nr:MAG: hypothetical protein M1820_005414 [Bogoriella megaspora]
MAPTTRSKKRSNRSSTTRSLTASKRTSKTSPSKQRQSKSESASKSASNPGSSRRGKAPPQRDNTTQPRETDPIVPSTQGLCFNEAITAFHTGQINEAEYFTHLLAHFGGLRHQWDLEYGHSRWGQVTTSLGTYFLVADEIRQISLRHSYQSFEENELNLCQNLFLACSRGDQGDFETAFHALASRRTLLLELILRHAALEGRSNIFRFCIPYVVEAKIKPHFPIETIVFKDPEILDALLESNWQNIQKYPRALKFLISPCLHKSDGTGILVLRWLFDHGVRIPFDKYQLMGVSPPRSEVLDFLLELNPNNIFRTGMLQYVAESGNIPLIERLIKAGIDVNQDPPDLGDIREPGPFRALWMTIGGSVLPRTIESKHVQAARLLLENGANMHLPAGTWTGGLHEETALQAAERKGNADMLALFNEYRNRSDD